MDIKIICDGHKNMVSTVKLNFLKDLNTFYGFYNNLTSKSLVGKYYQCQWIFSLDENFIMRNYSCTL